MRKRILSTLLMVAMLLTLLPTVALADYMIAYTYDDVMRLLNDPTFEAFLINPNEPFGWPTIDTTLTLNKDVGIYYGRTWTIPANVTVTGPNFSTETNASVIVEGRLEAANVSGTITVEDGGTVKGSVTNATITVENGGTLEGSVTNSTITVKSGGTLKTGSIFTYNPDGTMNSHVTMENGSTLVATGDYLHMKGNSTLTLNETTNVTANRIRLNGSTLVGNDATLTDCVVETRGTASGGTISGTLTLKGNGNGISGGIRLEPYSGEEGTAALTIPADSTVTIEDKAMLSILGASAAVKAVLNLNGTLTVKRSSSYGITINEWGSINLGKKGVLHLHAPTSIQGEYFSDANTYSEADQCITGEGTVYAYYNATAGMKNVFIYDGYIEPDSTGKVAKPHIADGVTVHHVVPSVEPTDHTYTYTASGATITETCSGGCGHSETATLSVTGSHTYTGVAQEPANVSYSGGWGGGKNLTVSYINNTAAGTATASITCDGAKANVNFDIAAADYTATPSAESGSITVGAEDGPDLIVATAGVNSETVAGTLTGWYSDSGCTTSIDSFSDYAVGSHTIYWKYTTDNTNYVSTPKTGSFTLKVEESAPQTMTWSDPEGNLSTTYGTPITGKTASVTGTGGGEITYASSKPSVATVDAATGALTIVGAGETTITATAKAVPGQYRETSIIYILNVDEKDVTVTVTPASRKFGQDNPTFAATVPAGGLVNGDTIDNLGLGLHTTATAASNVGRYNVTGDGVYNANYNVTVNGTDALTVTQADARTLDDISVNQKYTVTARQSRSVAGLMPNDAGTLTYAKETETGTVSSCDWAVDSTGTVTFTLTGAAGNSVTLPVVIGSTNYENSTVNVVITLTDKDVPTVSANAITVIYTGEAVPASAITGTATFSGAPVAGTWSWKGSPDVTVVADSGLKTVVFTPTDGANYATVEATIQVTINKATPTGAPRYTAITEANKTLADAALTAEGGTFSLTGGVKWVDANGLALDSATVVTANTSYRWLFTPEDTANYNTLSGSVTLYRVSTGGGGSVTPPVNTTPEVSTGSGTSTATVDVTGKTSGTTTVATVPEATVTNAITAAVEAAGSGTAAVEIKVDTPADADSLKVSLPSTAMDAVAESKAETLTITSGVGELTISSEAAASIAQQAGKTDVTVTIAKVDTEKTLNDRQQAAIGDAPVYDLSVTAGGNYISEFDGGLITVSLPHTLKPGEDPAGVVVWYMDENGNIEKLRAMYDVKSKTVVFTTNHFSLYVVGYDEIAALANPFADVADDAYYCDAVKWAVHQNITSGTGATTFAPDATCTRAQAVTFLWRANGSPEPASTVNPFTDVSADAYYCKAVLWAVEQGITSGTGEATFSPDATCSRAQIVTFLYRAAGSPAVETANSFTDVEGDAYYAAAVNWAVKQGITSGTSATTFSPDANCTRAQIVTFLYRAFL